MIDRGSSNQEESMSNGTLRQDVLDELEFEPSIDANNMGVAATAGVVTLSGHAGAR